ncbi:unnamed protein product [Rotaria sp. Silwood1]|nr:unnamed protein product [Rotaria sp. Silwood1]CAF4618483.1 unnamed protein product [Rotaria sp. Silwood1]
MSGGIDIKWRKKTINELKNIQPKIVLDVATGTADVAILTNRILHPTKIVGIDISEGMLNLGKEKVAKLDLQNTIELELGDSEQINFPDNHFDAVTVAYGVRNFEHLEKGLKEILRVLKPGGKLAILEASKPANKLFRSLSKFYMLKIIPKFGGILSGNKNAYLYLNNSVQAFPEGKQFLNILIDTGFTQTYLKTLSLGDDSILVAEPASTGGISLGFHATAKLSKHWQVRFNPQIILGGARSFSYTLGSKSLNETTAQGFTLPTTLVTFPLSLKFNSDRIDNFRTYLVFGVFYLLHIAIGLSVILGSIWL